jgi:hypothetical protein
MRPKSFGSDRILFRFDRSGRGGRIASLEMLRIGCFYSAINGPSGQVIR